MRGFPSRTSVGDAISLLDARTHVLPAEDVPVSRVVGRVLAEPIVANVDVPNFDRAAMDGYAVIAQDTDGATADLPRRLHIVGTSLPARSFAGMVASGEAVRIATGAAIPDGANAVLMVENASEEPGTVFAKAPVAAGKNIVRKGEDVVQGRTLLQPGRRLRPQDVGMIAAVGVPNVAVVRRPQVAILVTGDEVLPPGSTIARGNIIDSNSPMLTALVERDGGECRPVRYLPDQYAAIRDAIRDAAADVVLVSGGTSVGPDDHAPRAVAELGELAIHGVALRPATPTGIGFLTRGTSSAVVVLLPGNPVACLCAYDLFAGRVIRRLGSRDPQLPYRSASLPLVADIVSVSGRTDYVRVQVLDYSVLPLAVSGASILSSTVAADGFVIVDHECTRLAASEQVRVWFYD